MRCDFNGALDCPCALNGHAPGNLVFDFFRCRADQQRKDSFLAQRFLQYGVIAAFVFPTQHDQDSSGKRVQRLQRGIDVGRLRIVVIAHAADFRDKLEAMLDSRERAHSFRDSRGFGSS